MLTIRHARWPEDFALLERLDTSFTTDRVYRVVREGHGFTLVEEAVDPPLRKDYEPLAGEAEAIRAMDSVFTAEVDGVPVGLAAAKYEAWNRRMVVWHLYVAAEHRGRGIGRTLLECLAGAARGSEARCLWVETQNVNYPAVQFYRRLDFRLCGLDDSLYDPAGPAAGEVALFFSREVP